MRKIIRSKWNAGIFGMLVFLAAFLSTARAGDRGFSNERSSIHYTRVRTFDMIHEKLNLNIDMPRQAISGYAEVTLSPINNGLSFVSLDAVDLNIKKVRLVGQAGSLPFSLMNGKLKIKLDHPYQEKDTLSLRIDYDAAPKMGLYFVHPDKGYPNKHFEVWSQGEMEESRHWFPCYDAPNDRMTTETVITVPEDFVVISNGKLLQTTMNRGQHTATYHWKESVPHVTYLVSIAVGKYAKVEDNWKGIPVQYYVEKPDVPRVSRSFSLTPDMIDFFSKVTGVPYPYEKYAQVAVEDFIYGGMENISATTQTAGTLHDERAELDHPSDGLVAHELAHQWAGDLVTTKNWNNIWLNEGFATFFETAYVEHHKGWNEYLMRMQENRKAYMKEDSEKYRRSIVTNKYENPEDMFDRHTYQKGSWVLHMMRYVLGDELFWKGMRHYLHKYREKTVETNDFREAYEEATGRPLEWFFNEWVYKAGYPELKVSWNWDDQAREALLNVRQTQKVDDLTPLFRMPVDIEFSGGFGVQTRRIWMEKADQTFRFALPSRPTRVEFDPDDRILKTIEFDKPEAELLDQLAHSSHVISRIHAARWLTKYWEDAQAVDSLAQALRSDKFWAVRQAAAKSLGEIGGKAALKALLAGLNDGKSQVRREVIKSLGKFQGNKKAASALRRVFRKDRSYENQAEAIKSLAKIGAKDAYKYCLKALKTNSYRETVRQAAFKAMVTLKNPRAVDKALEWIVYGKPEPVRGAAMRALAKLAKIVPSREAEIRRTLQSYLTDPLFRTRLAAIEALGDLGDKQAVPVLKARLGGEVQYRHQRAIHDALDDIRKANAEEAPSTN